MPATIEQRFLDLYPGPGTSKPLACTGSFAAVAAVTLALTMAPAASWAGGFYLLVAPRKVSGAADSGAPLAQWSHEMSYDSARECEAGRVERFRRRASLERPGAPAPRPREDGGAPAELDEEVLRHAMNAESRCVASDDPRLRCECR